MFLISSRAWRMGTRSQPSWTPVRNAPRWEECARPWLLVADEFLDRVIEPRRVFLRKLQNQRADFPLLVHKPNLCLSWNQQSGVMHCLLATMLKHENFLHLCSSQPDLRAVLVDGELPACLNFRRICAGS